jgi:hypothetical protein
MSRPAPKIYFFCIEQPPLLQDDLVCLAEGLRALGIEYYSSANYWLRSPGEPEDWLFRQTPKVDPRDCDAVVFPRKWFEYATAPWLASPPEELFKSKRPPALVYLDLNNGYRTPAFEEPFRRFDFILRGKMNRRCAHPSNFHPWQLGLMDRVLRMTEDALSFAERRRAILWNFGASHPFPHGSRDAARKRFLPLVRDFLPPDETLDDLSQEPADPYDRLMWRQTIRRHSRAYYERLKGTVACAAFCGDLAPALPFDPNALLVGGRRARWKRFAWDAVSTLSGQPPRIIQWDSWRFWEALAAGCVPIHVDLELYGVALPVMPENWRHYIGMDLRRPRETADRLRDEPELLERVSREGRDWALTHYSPRAVAKRFLRIVCPSFEPAAQTLER